METAKLELLTEDIRQKCELLGIAFYVLKNSKRNTIAFVSGESRKHREFEIMFLSNGCYRISTRFIGYKNVMDRYCDGILMDNDPDGRRIRFNITKHTRGEVNEFLMKMLDEGYSENPSIELI